LVLAQQLTDANTYHVDSIGDSSPLLIDTEYGTVTEITPRDENAQGQVTQVVGPEGASSAPLRRSNRARVQLKPGQTLLLATDGFTKYMDKGKILPANVLAVRKTYSGDNRGFVNELIRMANTQGGSDNITIVSIPFDPRFAKAV
jgi:serine/threonine protein phosphatase PrpC